MKTAFSRFCALAFALALTSSALTAAENYYIGPEDGDWFDNANWTSGTAPASTSDVIYLASDSSAVLTGSANVGNFYIGSYNKKATGSGTLLIDGGSLSVNTSYSFLGREDTTGNGGSAVLTLANGSYMYVKNSLAIGYVTTKASAPVSNAITASVTVDATSSISSGDGITIGRGTQGTLSLLGSDLGGALVTLDRVYVGQVTLGSQGYLYVGTNASLMATGSRGQAYLYSGSTIAIDGGLLNAKMLLATSSSPSAGISTVSTISMNNGALALQTTASLQTTSATLVNGSSMSVGTVLTLSAGSAMSLTDSNLSVGTNLFMTATASTIAANASTLSVGSTLTLGGGSAISLADSELSVGTNMAVAAASSLALDNSTASVGSIITNSGGTISLSNGAVLSAQVYGGSNASTKLFADASTVSIGSAEARTVTPSNVTSHATFSNGSSLLIGENGYFTLGRLTLSDSILSVTDGGMLVASKINYSNTGYSLSQINSTVSVNNATFSGAQWVVTGTGAATLSNGAYANFGNVTFSTANTSMAMDNATLVVTDDGTLSGRIANLRAPWTVANSTVSAAIFESRYGTSDMTFSNSVITLASPNATTAFSQNMSTGDVYLQNGTQMTVADNGKFLFGHLLVGSGTGSASFSMTGGEGVLTYKLGIGYKDGEDAVAGFVDLTGGSLTLQEGVYQENTTDIWVGMSGGAGTLTVSGTATVSGVTTMHVNRSGTFSGALYVGDYDPTAASYVFAKNLAVTSGATLLGTAEINGPEGAMTLALNGSALDLAAVLFDALEFYEAGLTVDFSSLTDLSDAIEITLLKTVTLAGLDVDNIITANLDDSYSAVYAIANGTDLVATLTYAPVPEPSAAAALLGLLALAFAARRRK